MACPLASWLTAPTSAITISRANLGERIIHAEHPGPSLAKQDDILSQVFPLRDFFCSPEKHFAGLPTHRLVVSQDYRFQKRRRPASKQKRYAWAVLEAYRRYSGELSRVGRARTQNQAGIHLRALGFEYQEIATAMQMDVGTVGALLSRAVRKLKGMRLARETMP